MRLSRLKKGMTLVELMVAMSIFSILLLVAVGAFISMNNLRAVALNARESQQKLRLAIEMISRYSRQAEKVIIGGTGSLSDHDPSGVNSSDLSMYFNLEGTPKGVKFVATSSGQLTFFQCVMTPTFPNFDCTNWGAGSNLLSGDVKMVWDAAPYSGFRKNKVVSLKDSTTRSVAMPPSLSIKLAGKIVNNKDFYNNDFNIDTRVILENIK